MNTRIGGLMVLAMVSILAVAGMVWGFGNAAIDHETVEIEKPAHELERMNTIQGTLLINGQARNGVEAALWRAEAFSSPPGFGDPEPDDARFQIGDPVITGREHGGDGAYRFDNVPDGKYYVSLEVGRDILWEGHSMHSGSRKSRLRSQVLEYSRVTAGQTATLADVKGSGVVRQIFLAISSSDKSVVEDGTWIRVYANGESTPSMACPVSQFFAYTHEAEPFQIERIGVTRKVYAGDPEVPVNHRSYDRGAYRFIDIPYSTELRIDLDAGDSADLTVFSVVYYQDTPIPFDYGRRNYLKAQHFHEESVAPYSSVELLDVAGKGSLDSMVLSGASPDGHQVLEGNLEIYVDGESMPSIYVSGTEDITGNAFYFGFDQLRGHKQGATVHDGNLPIRWTQYRFFDWDRIDFDHSLRVVLEAGHKGQSGLLVNPVEIQSTHFYYLDTLPLPTPDPSFDLVIEDDFTSYGESAEITSPWVQGPGNSKWTQRDNSAVFDDLSSADAWMYYDGSEQWADQIVEADVRIRNQGTGEVWLFARGTQDPIFSNRVTFGFSAVGAFPEHPNYQPLMLFISSGDYAESSLLFVPSGEQHTLRLEVFGSTVTASLKRQQDSDFRKLFRHVQSGRLDGVSGISVVTGDVAVNSFRIFQRR